MSLQTVVMIRYRFVGMKIEERRPNKGDLLVSEISETPPEIEDPAGAGQLASNNLVTSVQQRR
jgi:hypothetical protein